MKKTAIKIQLLIALGAALRLSAANTYDLTNDWAANTNPNGVWGYWQGSNRLTWAPALYDGTKNNTMGIGGGYTPSNVAGRFNPEMFKATASGQLANNPNDWHAGDVIVSSVDSGNGNPALGEATITWTSPFNGTITYSGAAWYAQANVQRSNDFTLRNLATNTTLASGTLSYNGGFNRANPINFSSNAPITVNAGDVLALTVFRTSSSTPAAYTGLRLTITEVPAATTAVLPQLAFGGGWYTALYFTNTSNGAASVAVNFIGNDGTPLTVPSLGGSSANVTLGPRGSVLIECPNSGPLLQGYATATLPTGVTGYGVFRQTAPGVPDQEAVVPLSSSTATTNTLIFDNNPYTTAVAIVNLSSATNTITAVAYDNQGNNLGTGTVVLAAQNKTALALASIPGLAAVANRIGSIDFISGNGNSAVLGLRFNGSALTSIPATEK